ncbi:MAG: tRNA 4-thiouridine(8) synthase ThiI [Candidatus Marinimicrobia bacterium]|nr:tRNA 4-thiouridine(8) synthase ThiI [Candidatus Neomarinimicrobiota bacterium]
MKFDTILCHYAEVGLKIGNRRFFENWLKQNIKASLLRVISKEEFDIRKIHGRILVELKKDISKDKNNITRALSDTFGVAYFAFAKTVSQDIRLIREESLSILNENQFETFKIKARRPDHRFLLTAQQVNEDVGAFVLSKINKTVKLNDPDITCFIDIVQGVAYLYTEKIIGPGGLPTGANGKVVGLLSAGIDSPVATIMAMKRGASVILVHFHSVPITTEDSIEKVKQLTEVLRRYQSRIHLYLVALTTIQKEILVKTKEKFRILLYRRFMIRVAEMIAKKDKAKALITGESLGQVASQTLGNIAAIESVSTIPILRPLIGLDKQEIMDLAKHYGTYDISILPDQDCCSLFVPKNPATNAKKQYLDQEENNLNIDDLMKEAIDSIEYVNIK